nr:cupin domain-containing protein [Cupriavidus lacunae]
MTEGACIYALEGLIRYSVDGVVRDLTQGAWMHTPKGSVHAFSNPHQATAKALIVLTPDLGAQYFLDVQGAAFRFAERQLRVRSETVVGQPPVTARPGIPRARPEPRHR